MASETVNITYQNGNIVLRSNSFVISASLPSDELMNIYWTGKGKGSVTITEPPLITLQNYIAALVAAGKSQEEIMKSSVHPPVL